MKKYLLIVLLGIAGVLLIGCNKDKSDLNDREEEDLYAVSVVAGINNIKLNAPIINLSNNSEETEDEEDFENLLVIEINKKDTYNFYFNEVLIKEEVEKDDEDNELEEEKEVIVLYAMEDYKHKEIAEILNKPIGTVIWIYNKAMKKLRNAKGGITL